VKVHAAEGGFYLFPDFCHYKNPLAQCGIHTCEQFTATLMDETGVALLPGSAFGMEDGILTTRLAFVDFDGNQIWNEEAPADFEKIKQGIKKLCDWLQAL
jgi:aspartate aminotransferase